MSTDYGYYCATCDEESPMWLNHGGLILRDLARDWPVWRAALEVAEQKAYRDYLEISFMGCYDDPLPFAWLMTHGDHALQLATEYGDRYDLVTEAKLPKRAGP